MRIYRRRIKFAVLRIVLVRVTVTSNNNYNRSDIYFFDEIKIFNIFRIQDEW